MHKVELELAVGDVVQIGNYVLTVIDVEGEEVSFRIDPIESHAAAAEQCAGHARPR